MVKLIKTFASPSWINVYSHATNSIEFQGNLENKLQALEDEILAKIDSIKDYIDMGINNYRLELFDEDYDKIKNLINVIRKLKS